MLFAELFDVSVVVGRKVTNLLTCGIIVSRGGQEAIGDEDEFGVCEEKESGECINHG